MCCASSLIGHDALGSGNDGDAKALENLRQLRSAGVDTQARLGDAAKTGNDLLLVAQVLQGDVDHALLAVLLNGVCLDIALVEQDLGNVLLEVGSGDIHSFVLCRVRIPDSGEHICNGIGDLHVIDLL